MRKSKVDADTDLTQEEGEPTSRADVLPARQKINVDLDLKNLRFTITTESRDDASFGPALSILLIALAGLVPGTGIGILLWLATAPPWLIAVAAAATTTGCITASLFWLRSQTRRRRSAD